MTTLYIPPKEEKKWRGIFPSRYAGSIQDSWNIDLERVPSLLSISGAMVRSFPADSDTTTIAVIQRFLSSNSDNTSRIWAFHSNGVAYATSPGLWSPDTYANTPTNSLNDAIVHGDTNITDSNAPKSRILVALNSTIVAFNSKTATRAWDTNWWSDTNEVPQQADLDNSGDHIFGKVQSLTIVTDGDAFHTIDKNDRVTRRRIVYPINYKAKCVYTTTERFWIGLENVAGGDGMIISWDGSSEGYKDYSFPGKPMSGWIVDGVPHFVNNYGQILKFQGWGFEEVRHFPCYEENLVLEDLHREGCVVDGKVVRILILAPRYSRTTRSGIWIYNLETDNLYLSQSLSDFESTRKEYGQAYLFRVGALFSTRYLSNTVPFIAGGAVYTPNDTTHIAIFSARHNNMRTSSIMRGTFVLSRIPARDVYDIFQKLILRYREFSDTDAKIVVKYRTTNPLTSASSNMNGPAVQQSSWVTWLTATTFRADSPTAIPSGVKVGHEVEIVAGQNGGCVFHISAISDTNGAALTATDTTTAIVTIDESAPAGGDTYRSYVRYDNWNKVDVTSDTSEFYFDFSLPGADSDGNPISAGPFVDIKVELRGRMMEIEQAAVVVKDGFSEE